MGRFEDYPGLVGTGVQLLENRLPATAREFESHTLRHFGVRMAVLTLFFCLPLCGCTGKPIISERDVECIYLIAGQFFEGNTQLLEVRYDPPVRHSFVTVIR